MTTPTTRSGGNHLLPLLSTRAVVLFLGVCLLCSGIALVFSYHKHDPFEAFTSAVPRIGIPVVVGAYAALVAAVWGATPRPRSEFVDEFIRTGVTIVGGGSAPHLLTFLFSLFR